jgi:hypothetical protein
MEYLRALQWLIIMLQQRNTTIIIIKVLQLMLISRGTYETYRAVLEKFIAIKAPKCRSYEFRSRGHETPKSATRKFFNKFLIGLSFSTIDNTFH